MSIKASAFPFALDAFSLLCSMMLIFAIVLVCGFVVFITIYRSNLKYLRRCAITEKMVEAGDTVKFNFIGKFDNGSVFDTSDTPVSIEIGTGKLIKGLDKEILGMTEGEEKRVGVSPEEGYGVEDPNLVINIPCETFRKNNLEPHVGMMLKTSKGNGYVTQMIDKDVEVNFNHPLAGKNLTFDINIVEIVKS